MAPKVRGAYDELVAVILWIDAHSHSVDFPGEPRGLIAGACLDMALEHQAAVAALAEKQLFGSAHSILRSAIEALVRGMWFWRCATDEEISAFRAEDRMEKGFGALVDAVERQLGNGAAALSRMKNLHWSSLCSFTHTGFMQITRRYTAGELRPNYSEEDQVRALKFASGTGLLAAIELAALSRDREGEQPVLARCKEFSQAQRK